MTKLIFDGHNDHDCVIDNVHCTNSQQCSGIRKINNVSIMISTIILNITATNMMNFTFSSIALIHLKLTLNIAIYYIK